MGSIKANLEDLQSQIPEGVKLVAVSKVQPDKKVMEAYDAGHRLFGENKAQELIRKHPMLPDDIKWHFIGHLQRNKVKYIAPFVEMIESVDSLKLLKEINKEAGKNNRIINCLLQFHIAEEDSKFGLAMDEFEEMITVPEFGELKNISICGVMGMATFTDDMGQVRKEFRNLKTIFNKLKTEFFPANEDFKEVSMGMSGDFKVAIEEGSTIVRIGTAVFGERIYH